MFLLPASASQGTNTKEKKGFYKAYDFLDSIYWLVLFIGVLLENLSPIPTNLKYSLSSPFLMEKGVALLSGGIDSPVAIQLMQNRLEIVAVHFHQEPLSDKKEVEKVKELANLLGIKKIYLVPFISVLKTLTEKCNHKNYFILQKILMFKGAELVAKNEGAKNLITGENLGQVSSQTLSNLKTISKLVEMEIFRPLLTFDKQEIINIAKKNGTYEISKGPEICNLLGPKSPATKSDYEVIMKELATFDYQKMLEDVLKEAEIIQL